MLCIIFKCYEEISKIIQRTFFYDNIYIFLSQITFAFNSILRCHVSENGPKERGKKKMKAVLVTHINLQYFIQNFKR